MAIFHLSAKIISRGKGQSAIAAAAYRSGQKLCDEQTGEEKHYRARQERILYTDIMAPLHAPDWAFDRNELWNHAERAEKRKDSQLAREIEIGLPHELTDRQREWLVKDFAREAFVRKGYAVDIAIHAPDADSDHRNYHAHLMVTRRTIGPEGLSATKDWAFDKDQLGRWREQWANLVNRHLERHGHEARIDHRSLKDQGIDREPTIHIGYAANEMTARGAPSDRMTALNEILARNELRFDLAAIDAELKGLEKQAADERRQQAAKTDRRVSDDGQHRALIAASAARRRQQSWSQTGRSQSHASPLASDRDRMKPTSRAAMDQKPNDEQQQSPRAPNAVRPAPAEQGRETTQVAKPAEQNPAQSTDEKAKTETRQPDRNTSIIQTSQGKVPLVPIEHIVASQNAADQALAKSRAEAEQAGRGGESRSSGAEAQAIRAQVRRDQKIDAQAERAAAQEEARRRYAENYPYDRSRRLANQSGQHHQQTPIQVDPAVLAARSAQAGQQIARSSYRVVDRATGVVSSLADFVSNLLSSTPAEPQPAKISMRTLTTDPEARKQYQLAQHEEAKRRKLSVHVLDDIRRDAEAGRDLSAADVSKLPRSHQEQILAKGDPYVRELIESSRKYADQYWKGRERGLD